VLSFSSARMMDLSSAMWISDKRLLCSSAANAAQKSSNLENILSFEQICKLHPGGKPILPG
jgi:hypothetical protein